MVPFRVIELFKSVPLFVWFSFISIAAVPGETESAAPDSLYAPAARNIVDKIFPVPSNTVLIVNSEPKSKPADFVRRELEARDAEVHSLTLSNKMESGAEFVRELVNKVSGAWGLVFLLHPVHARFLVETVGRPDLGMKLPEDHLFCDWLIPEPSLVRTWAIDMIELQEFRAGLLREVTGAGEIRVTSRAGTDITLFPRDWQTTDGEIYTASHESRTRGTIFVDGCAYSGPPKSPFGLKIVGGRVVNSYELDREDKQQNWVIKDLARDGNSSVLCEFGIGINPGALADQNVMEAEQARGTVHFGFGDNVAFGGDNISDYHIDYVILKPSIIVDRKVICDEGEFISGL